MGEESDKQKTQLEELCIQINACGLHQRAAYAYPYVSQTQFSVARFYGGCKVNGENYIYWPKEDVLVRDDVHKWLMNQKHPSKKGGKRASDKM